MSLSSSLLKRFTILAAALAPVALVTGCANMVGTASGSNSISPAATITGNLHGGNQPISNATVTLYSAGTTGYGSPATTLFATVNSSTDGNGTFQFSQLPADSSFPTGVHDSTKSVYSCPTTGDPQMYIIAKGGSTQGPFSPINSAAAFIIALGKCSGVGSLFVNMNEVTTVATLAALQQYFNPSTESLGYNNTAQSALGFANGVATLANLVNIASGAANAAFTPTSSFIGKIAAGTPTPINVTITPETAKINTMANILAACVNTASQPGSVSPNCQALFNAAVFPPSGSVTSQPSSTYIQANDTLQAAYYMLVNPVDAGAQVTTCVDGAAPAGNMACLYTLGGAGFAPFQPALTAPAPPTDWTVAITYSTPITSLCTGGSTFINYGYQDSVDANGNVWMANGNGTSSGLAEMSPTGVPLACSDIAYNKVRGGAVIDTTGNVWATSDAGAVVYKFDGTTTTTIPVAGATFTYGIGADGKGNVFFADPSGLKLYELPSTATAATVPTLIGPVTGSSPFTVAVDTKGTVVVGQSGSGGSVITAYPTTTVGGSIYPAAPETLTQTGAYAGVYGVAFDASGGFWVGNSAGTSGSGTTPGNTTSLTPVTYASSTPGDPNSVTFGTPVDETAIFAGGLSTARQVAIDGAGNVWTPDNTAASSGLFAVSEFTKSGAPLSPSSTTGTTTVTQNGGFQKAATVLAGPRGIAIDPTGNVWVTDTNSTTNNWITEIVGAAVPVVTPLSVATANNQLGVTP